MSYEPIPRDEPLYPRLEAPQMAQPHVQPQQIPIQPHVQAPTAPAVPSVAINFAPSFQVVIPPAPTREELLQKLEQRRVRFDGCLYLREGWNFARHNCCMIFLVMLFWILITLVLHLIIMGTVVTPMIRRGEWSDGPDYFPNGTDGASRHPTPHYPTTPKTDGTDGHIPDDTVDTDEAWRHPTPHTPPTPPTQESVVDYALDPESMPWDLKGMIALFLVDFLIFSPLLASSFIAVFAAMRENTLLKFTNFFSAFKCPYYFRLLGLSLLLHLGRSLGFHLLLLPGIWFTVVTAFAIPLHVENRFLGVCSAMKFSHKVLKHYFWNFLGFAFCLILLNIGGLLLLGVGALVTIPVSFFALCSCYNYLVGINGAPVMVPVAQIQQPQQPQQQPQPQPQQPQPQPQPQQFQPQPQQFQPQPQQFQPQPQQFQPQFTQPLYPQQQQLSFSAPTVLPPVAAPVSFLPRTVNSNQNHYTSLPATASITPPVPMNPQYPGTASASILYTPTPIPSSTVNPYPGQM